MVAKTVWRTACYNGGQTAREKSRKHNHECVALRLLIMGRIHPCMRISCKGELGNAWQNAFCVYILSVCTKLDVYLQGTLGKWFLLGSTSGRLQAYVALALGFASSSCLRTWGKVFHVAGTKLLPHSIRLFFHSPKVARACLHESSNYRTCILEHMSHGLSLIWHTFCISKALLPTNYGVRTEDGAWGSCHNSLTARPSLM